MSSLQVLSLPFGNPANASITGTLGAGVPKVFMREVVLTGTEKPVCAHCEKTGVDCEVVL